MMTLDTTPPLEVLPSDRLAWAMAQASAQVAEQTGPDLDATLLTSAQAALRELGWEVVWGPIVRQWDGDGQAYNSMFAAAKIDDPSQIYISIAGTNPDSYFDWLVEDGMVGFSVPWVGSDADGEPRISLGTAIGLLVLLTSEPSSRVLQTDVSLTDWLATQVTAGSHTTFTGHSLGGALSPTLALWFAQLQGVAGLWDPQRLMQIATTSFAGPSPGDADFAALYDQRLGSGQTRRWWNALDIVPHAWNLDQLAEIPELYAPTIPVSLAIEAAVALARRWSQQGAHYTQLVASTPAFAGSILPTAETHHESVEAFFAQAVLQHTEAYAEHFSPPASLRKPSKSAAERTEALLQRWRSTSPKPAAWGEVWFEGRQVPTRDAAATVESRLRALATPRR